MPERGKADHDPHLSFFVQQQLVGAAKKAFQQLAALNKNATLYPPAHPSLLSSAEQLGLTLEDIFLQRNEAAFTIIAGELFFETFSVPVDENLSLLVDEFVRRDIGSIVFQPGLARGELVAFACLMREDPPRIAAQGGMDAMLTRQGASHIAVRRVIPLERKQDPGQKDKRKRSSVIFIDAIDTVKDMIHSVHRGKALNERKIKAVVHTMVDSILDNRDALLGLTSIKLYDEYTFAHSVNVAILSIAMGAFLSLEKSRIAALGTSGMLHDIGKVNIPIDIINKPEALTEEEWEIMKRHPVDGAVILSGMSGVSRLAMVAAFEHHLHYDARGYPRIGRSQLHPFSQIVSISDAYDALTSARVYYGLPTPPDEAVRTLLEKRGTIFDPMLVKAFVNMVGIFPIGTVLRLNTGETGLVVHQTRDLLRPRVLLLRTFDGAEKDEVSLLEMEKGRYRRTIAASLNPHSMNIDLNPYFS